MNSSPVQEKENTAHVFAPSNKTVLLPIALTTLGLLFFLFFKTRTGTLNPETNFLGWGFILIGIFGVLLNTFGIKKYRLEITDEVIRLYPREHAPVDLEIPRAAITRIQIQQSTVGKLLQYGNLNIQYGKEALFVQDLDQVQRVAALLDSQDQSTQL